MLGLSSNDQDREVAILLDVLETLHDLEPIEAWHRHVEQNQVVVILPVQLPDPVRIGRGGDCRIPGALESAIEQENVCGLIVDDEELGSMDVRLGNHPAAPTAVAGDPGVAETLRAASRLSMNSFTLMGLVR